MADVTGDFSAVCGNRAVKKRLSDALRSSSLPHALLLAGPEGSGKHTLALSVAAAQNCARKETPGEAIPCGVCSNCRRIFARRHPDVRVLGKPKDKASIGVGDLRTLREDMFLSPTEAAYKFYLIEDAEDMTPQAQNALLKVLEEPPRGVFILLLTAVPERLLPTVRSRAPLLRTEPIPDDELALWLRKNNPAASRMASLEPARYKKLIRLSDGRMGKALRLLDPKALTMREAEAGLIRDLVFALRARAPYSELYSAIRTLPQKREPLCDALELLLIALRDMTVCRTHAGAPLFFETAEEARALAEEVGETRLSKITDAVFAALDDAQKNVVIQTLLADLSSQISACRDHTERKQP